MAHFRRVATVCAFLVLGSASTTLEAQQWWDTSSIGDPPRVAALPAPTPGAVVPREGNAAPSQLPPIESRLPPSTPIEDDLVVVDAASLKLGEPWKIGDFKLVPYGALWADMIYQTDRTYPGAFTLYVPSAEQEGESAFYLDARRTRLGFDLTGPDVGMFGGAKSGGRLEIDFFGQFINENQSGVQLRHGYWDVKNDRWRMLVGQEWDIISPLNPNTVNYSVGWMGGTSDSADRSFAGNGTSTSRRRR